MSATTPTYILESIYRNAKGLGGDGPMVTLADWRKYMLDMDGWFMWQGDMVEMRLKTIGGGLYRIQGVIR